MAKVKAGLIKDLKFDERNLNRHTEKGKELVKKSIEELGLARSVVTDKNGKLIAGNNATEQAIAAGKTKTLTIDTDGETLVVVRRTDLDLDTDQKARALALADNSTAAASLDWDFEAIHEQAEEFGFDYGEWGVEMPEEDEKHLKAKEDDYQSPDVIHTDIVLGDLFEFRKGELCHRLLCGDSTNVDDVDKLMGGEKADFVITSPPYNTGGFNADAAKDSEKYKAYPYLSDEDSKTQEDYLQFNRDIFNSILLSTTENSNILYNISYNQNSPYEYILIIADAIKSGFKLHETIIWKKSSAMPLRSRLTRITEFVFMLSRYVGDNPITTQEFEETRFNFWEISNINSQSAKHGAAYPVEFASKGIEWFCKGSLIFEPFTGSGTTMVAAHQLERNCYGMELDPKYCQVIVDRMINLDPEIKVFRNGKEYEPTVVKPSN